MGNEGASGRCFVELKPPNLSTLCSSSCDNFLHFGFVVLKTSHLRKIKSVLTNDHPPIVISIAGTRTSHIDFTQSGRDTAAANPSGRSMGGRSSAECPW